MREGEDPAEGAAKKSAGDFVPPSIEALDAVLDHYEFIDILGRGGMGAVYKGRQKSMNRLVAIKILPKTEDDDGLRFAERFQREARAMAQMAHPNIVTVYDFGQTADGQLFFVMEYVDGTDLHHVIREGRVDRDRIFKWIEQICDALFYAHSMGVVHRDIKPANIMLTKEGIVKVADFGLAKLTGGHITDDLSRLTMTNVAMGTPDYVAPEALEAGAEVDHRADIYAMGVMLYEMLTGKIPRGVWKPPSQLVEGVDRRFDEVVMKAMDSEPGSRFQQATELSAHLLEIRDQPNGPAVPAVRKPRQVKLVTGPVQPKIKASGVPEDATGPASPQRPAAKKKHAVRKGARGRKEGKGVFIAGSIAAVTVAAAILVGLIVNNLDRGKGGTDERSAAGSSSGSQNTDPAPQPSLFANDHSPELEAIRWVLDQGGGLTVYRIDQNVTIKSESDLPPKPWKVNQIHIDAHGNRLEGMSALSALEDLAVVWIDADIGDEDVLHFAEATGITGITIVNSRVTGKNFGQLAFLTGLQYVTMDGSPFDDTGMSHLAKFKRLRDILLNETAITDAGLAHLNGYTSITSLKIARTAVTSKGLDQLRGLTNLKSLVTRDCPQISEASRLAFQEAHPNCKLDPPLKSRDPVQRSTGLDPDVPPGLVRKLTGHNDIIRGVAILPDSMLGLSVSWDRSMKLWDLENGENLKTFGPAEGLISSLAVSTDGKLAVTGSSYPRADLWDIRAGKKAGEFIIPEPATGGAAFSPNGSRLLIGDSKGGVFLFDRYRPQKPLNSWKAHSGSVGSISFLSGGRHFVTAGQSKDLPGAKLWSVDSTEPVRVFGPHPNGVASLAIHPSDEFLLTGGGGGDGKLRLWNLKSGGAATRTLSGHPGAQVVTVQFLPGSRFAVSSGTDKAIRFWDLIEGKKVDEIAAESHSTNYLDLSPDGRFALSGGGFKVISRLEKDDDFDLRLWQLPELPGTTPRQESTSGGQEWIDLLSSVEVNADTRGGTWEKNETGLFTNPDGVHEKLALPVVPKGNYDLNIRFQRISGDDATAIQLPVGDRFVNLVLSGWTRPGQPAKSALQPIADVAGNQPANPTMTTDFQMESGRPYGVFVTVNREGSNARISVSVDDERLIDWAGPLSDLVYDDPVSPDAGRLWLSSAGTHVRFHKVQLRMNSGNAEFVRETPPAIQSDPSSVQSGRLEVVRLSKEDVHHLRDIPESVANSQDLVSVKTNFRSVMVLREDGSTVGWGRHRMGQYGSPREERAGFSAIDISSSLCVACRPDGSFVIWSGSGPVPNQPAVNDVVAVAAGNWHVLLLQKNGKVAVWSRDADESHQPPADLDNAVAIAAGHKHSLALRQNGTVVAWGENQFGQCDVPEDLPKVKSIACVFHQSFAVTAEGKVISWGHPDNTAKPDDAKYPVKVPADLDGVVRIVLGKGRGAAQLEDGSWRFFVGRRELDAEASRRAGKAIDIAFGNSTDFFAVQSAD